MATDKTLLLLQLLLMVQLLHLGASATETPTVKEREDRGD